MCVISLNTDHVVRWTNVYVSLNTGHLFRGQMNMLFTSLNTDHTIKIVMCMSFTYLNTNDRTRDHIKHGPPPPRSVDPRVCSYLSKHRPLAMLLIYLTCWFTDQHIRDFMSQNKLPSEVQTKLKCSALNKTVQLDQWCSGIGGAETRWCSSACNTSAADNTHYSYNTQCVPDSQECVNVHSLVQGLNILLLVQ